MCNFPTIKDAADVAIATMLSGIQVEILTLYYFHIFLFYFHIFISLQRFSVQYA